MPRSLVLQVVKLKAVNYFIYVLDVQAVLMLLYKIVAAGIYALIFIHKCYLQWKFA